MKARLNQETQTNLHQHFCLAERLLFQSYLVLAIFVQGGVLLNRTQETVQRDDAPENETIDPRIYILGGRRTNDRR